VQYRIETDTADDGPEVVLTALGLRYGDMYLLRNDLDHTSFLEEVDVQEESGENCNGKWWMVTLNYGPFNAAEQAADDGNPLKAQPEISWGFRDIEEVIRVDFNGDPVVNTAGEPFDPPLTDNLPGPVMTITRNEPIGTYSPRKAYEYRGAVNSDVFAGEDPGFARVLQIGGKRAYHGTCGWYFQVTYEFEFNPDGYTRRINSMGFREVGADGKLAHILTNQGTPISSPALLDQNGKWLSDPNAEPYVMEFRTRKQLPFAVFNFDEDWLQGLK
jgi:hypothetical protein